MLRVPAEGRTGLCTMLLPHHHHFSNIPTRLQSLSPHGSQRQRHWSSDVPFVRDVQLGQIIALDWRHLPDRLSPGLPGGTKLQAGNHPHNRLTPSSCLPALRELPTPGHRPPGTSGNRGQLPLRIHGRPTRLVRVVIAADGAGNAENASGSGGLYGKGNPNVVQCSGAGQ